MSTNQKKCAKTFRTDTLALNLGLKLFRDFRAVLGQGWMRKESDMLLSSIPDFRLHSFPEVPGTVSPFFFKAHRQMENLYKKYRFASDLYTDSELEERTNGNYFDFQEFLLTPRKRPLSTFLVLQEARKIAKRILGPFDPEAVVREAKFGKKSSIGCPFSSAYLDNKLSKVAAFTGSTLCSKWFYDSVLPDDGVLSRIIQRLPNSGRDADLEHDTLTLFNVPKSWKILRGITPLTLLGLFYSFGVGECITSALKKEGLDISRLQERHRLLIRKYSVTLSHVTADLSSASDSITMELVNQVLPRQWYNAVKAAITHQIVVKTKSSEVAAYTGSVLPMGNGFTFPLETLIFYCIIKAIGTLTNCEGTYSVYGDDLIYPRKIHQYVARIFPTIGFKLNTDKTYASFPFRESCGADYYRGCDVRPFILRGESRALTRTQYLGELYKIYNGLTRRWDAHEIRGTLQFLLVEMASCSLPLCRVPPQFPETSGIRVDSPGLIPLDCSYLDWKPVRHVFQHGTCRYFFSFLRAVPRKRFVVDVEPYYWLALQDRLDDLLKEEYANESMPPDIAPEPVLSWVKLTHRRGYTKNGKIVHRTTSRWKAAVAMKDQATTKECSGSVVDWT